MTSFDSPFRVLVYELNEVSWELLQPWMDSGELPHFRQLVEQGSWGQTVASEPSDLILDPWITWTSVHTGVPQPEHGVLFLEQPPETVRKPRLWDLCHAERKRIGVFGSINSWPPKAVRGFFVPGTFSRDSQTYPASLRPIQDLNLAYTRGHAPGAQQPSTSFVLRCLPGLIQLGLDPATLAFIASTLLEIKVNPDVNWKKVSLQPIINLAFFRNLFRNARPDFATFHTNHVAHYQHRFFRAWKPQLFPDPTSQNEINRFGDAIRFGYRIADQVLGTLMSWCQREQDLVLCVASSMGQRPYLPARNGGIAPDTCRIRSMSQLVNILGITGRCEYFSTMAPQWNIRIPDEQLRTRAVADLKSARYEPIGKPMYFVLSVKDTIVVTPASFQGLDRSAECHFPTLSEAPRFRFDELMLQADDTRKSGSHDPVGLIGFFGAPIRSGHHLDPADNLDIAPTLLSLLGMRKLDYMTGRVITESLA